MTDLAPISMNGMALSVGTRATSFDEHPLLAGVSPEASELFRAHLRQHELREGTVLWQAGQRAHEIFFPLSGTISIRVATKSGSAIEVATVGREGAAGIEDNWGLLSVLTEAAVQVRGRFIGLPAEVFHTAAKRCEELQRLADICTNWVVLQSQRMAACNALHSAEERFSRWLLRTGDALDSDTFRTTQETIANLIGLRRTTVTLIAGELQSRGAISVARGKITIRDHEQLRHSACDCYHVLERSYWPSELLRSEVLLRNCRPA